MEVWKIGFAERIAAFFFKQMGSFRILRVGMLFHIRILLEFQSISKDKK